MMKHIDRDSERNATLIKPPRHKSCFTFCCEYRLTFYQQRDA